jgi:hypothetical protein
MGESQPEVAGTLLHFVPRPRATTYLTPADRQEIRSWHEYILNAGFDRLTIHEREPGDHAEVGNFLALHRTGEAWAHYLFARRGSAVNAWCGVKGTDIGAFPTMRDALTAVLPQGKAQISALPPPHNVVTDLMPRLRRAAGG